MEKSKNSKGLICLVVILVIMVLGLGGYIVYDKVLTNEKEVKQVQKEPEPTVTPTEDTVTPTDEQVVQNNDNCALYKFDKTYQLTDNDKKEIAESIESMKAFNNEKVDINTIKITSFEDYYLFTTLETISKEGNYKFGALVFKINNKFKCYTFGSGYTKEQLDRLDYTFSRICS